MNAIGRTEGNKNMTNSVRSMSDLLEVMRTASDKRTAPEQRASVNPRIAAGLSSKAWSRKRSVRRRDAWQARAAEHQATATATRPVRDARIFEPFEQFIIRRFRAESMLDRRVTLEIQPPARAEAGQSVGAYFAAKWRRLGTLGDFEALNPYYDVIRKGGRDETQ